jgi:hypothetical protein
LVAVSWYHELLIILVWDVPGYQYPGRGMDPGGYGGNSGN